MNDPLSPLFPPTARRRSPPDKRIGPDDQPTVGNWRWSSRRSIPTTASPRGSWPRQPSSRPTDIVAHHVAAEFTLGVEPAHVDVLADVALDRNEAPARFAIFEP